MATNARILEVLSLLQARSSWTGAELAERLGVSTRTLRRDITALQDLGYPISTTRGVGGGYHLSPGSTLPPLVVSEEEAATIVLGLGDLAAGAHSSESRAAITALTKVVDVLPAKVRRRVEALRGVAAAPVMGDTRPSIDMSVLTSLALAARDRQTLTISYSDRSGSVTRRKVQPHDLVSADHRIYLIAYDLLRQDWRLFRTDRVSGPAATGQAFARRTPPYEDPVAYVDAMLAAALNAYEVRATVQTSAERAISLLAGSAQVEPVNEDVCEVTMVADRLEWVAFGLGLLGVPFELHGPPEAVDYFRAWSERFRSATGDA